MNPSLFGSKRGIEVWQPLVHVCRRWRNLVFGSPRRLDLQLYCTPGTPARDRLDVWPALPLIVDSQDIVDASSSLDNIISALGQSHRICEAMLVNLADCQLEEVLAAMQVPFPELTFLQLSSDDETPPVVPDSFLGGSAPRLQGFLLDNIPFPGLPKLLLSANHLRYLKLNDIPHSGYISPEAMAALLSVLSSLESLTLKFQSPQSRPNWESRSLPPLKRSILPALHGFCFRGVTEYLEDLVSFIDAPELDEMEINYFNQIDFDCPRLAQFINRTPVLRTPDEAHVQFGNSTASVTLRYQTSESDSDNLRVSISCREPDWQLSSIEQVCNSSLPSLSMVENLYIERRYSQLIWKNDTIENTLWLQLLHPFISAKNLHLSKEFAPGLMAALQELVGGRITEVLPTLQGIFVKGLELSGPLQENFGQFVAARQLSDHPIAISDWNGEWM